MWLLDTFPLMLTRDASVGNSQVYVLNNNRKTNTKFHRTTATLRGESTENRKRKWL